MTMNDFEQLETITDFNTRVDYLSKFRINDEDQPSCILPYFEDVKDQEDPFKAALLVAQAFKDNAGLIIFEHVWMSCTNGNREFYFGYESKYVTIMDDLETYESTDPVSEWLFIRAFKKLGFKNALECTKKELDGSMLAILLTRLYRARKHREVLWKIAEYYTARKYHPDHVLKYIKLD